MDDDDPIGGGTLVMTPQAPSPSNPERPGSSPGAGHARVVPIPIALPADPDRRLPRPPIFQVQQLPDPEDTSVDDLPTRLKQDSNSASLRPAELRDAGARNLHPAFAATQLQPFGHPPSLELDPSSAGHPLPPSHGFAAAPGATTLQGLGEAERMQLGGYPQAPFNIAGQGYIQPRVADEMSHTTADISGRRLVLAPIAIGAAAGLLVTAGIVGVILVVREPATPAVETAPSAVVIQLAPTNTVAPTVNVVSSAAPVASNVLPPAPTDADAKAQAALEKLKTGIEYCVKSTIHVLPGASPPVPSSITWLKSGPYESLKRDWASPFFSCTRFKLEEPMPFMIQWQVDVPNEKGTAVVWLDPNGDGVVDRAYGFKATLVKRDKVEFGPVEPVEAARKVQRAR